MSCNAASISKQRGAAMSSRLIPPNVGAIFFTVSMIDALSCVAKQIGNASISASPLTVSYTHLTLPTKA